MQSAHLGREHDVYSVCRSANNMRLLKKVKWQKSRLKATNQITCLSQCASNIIWESWDYYNMLISSKCTHAMVMSLCAHRSSSLLCLSEKASRISPARDMCENPILCHIGKNNTGSISLIFFSVQLCTLISTLSVSIVLTVCACSSCLQDCEKSWVKPVVQHFALRVSEC